MSLGDGFVVHFEVYLFGDQDLCDLKEIFYGTSQIGQKADKDGL